jgi:hypothetical protein
MIGSVKRKLKFVYNQILEIIPTLSRNYENNFKSIHDLKACIGSAHFIARDFNKPVADIQTTEFKVYSQWGDDGIIQYLINYLKIDEKTFIEFGVENYLESNTRFLLINNNWSGMVIDGNKTNIDFIQADDIYWRYDLQAIHSFISVENINQLIINSGFAGKVGLLSIDIDGNDYWVWKAIDTISPIIVIIEYNSAFGVDKSITVEYNKDFVRGNAHYSNIFYGASLKALCHLGEEKGYFFIGSNSHGNNAYFVRKDRASDLKILTPEQGYVKSKFKEHRNESGSLTYNSAHKMIKGLKGLKVVNVVTGETEHYNE